MTTNLLRTGGALAVAPISLSVGLSSGPTVFAQADSAVTPFKYRMADAPRTPSTSSRRPCRALPSPTSRPSAAGTMPASPEPERIDAAAGLQALRRPRRLGRFHHISGNARAVPAAPP